MARRVLGHRRKLLRARRSLIFGLPGLVGHAVDRLAAVVLAHCNALGVGGILHPVGEAIAAETGKIHQIDILNVGSLLQVRDERGERDFRRIRDFGEHRFAEEHMPERHAIQPADAPALVPGFDAVRVARAMQRRVTEQLGPVARPARIYVVNALPKTRSGKLLRRSLQALVQHADPGDLSTLDDPAALDDVRKALERGPDLGG